MVGLCSEKTQFEEDKHATTNIQNGLVSVLFLFDSRIILDYLILFHHLLLSVSIFELKPLNVKKMSWAISSGNAWTSLEKCSKR